MRPGAVLADGLCGRPGESGGPGRAHDQRYADSPVMASPSTSVWISWVPS
jgi:hypothetical protein